MEDQQGNGILQSEAFEGDVHEQWRGIAAVDEFAIIGTPTKVAELFAALAAAKGEFGPIAKTKHVKVVKEGRLLYEFDYAPLDEVIAATDGPLAKNGLAITHPMSGVNGSDDSLKIRTMLTHSGGAAILSVIRFLKGPDIQKTGSAMTYLQRYSRVAMLGVASETDDDGNSSIGNEATPTNRAPNGKPPRPAAVAPKAAPKPKDDPKPLPAAKAPERPATVPPPDPRQVTVDEVVERQTIPSEPPSNTVPSEPPDADDGALTLETRKAIRALIEELGIPAKKAGEMVYAVTGTFPGDVMGKKLGPDSYEGGSETHARTFLHHLQDLALEAQS